MRAGGGQRLADLDALVPAIAAGDAAAFGRWIALAEPAVRESLRGYARVVDTEAVVQEALLRVWQLAPGFAPDGRPNALLRLGVRVAQNLARGETRRQRREVAPGADAEARDEAPAPDPMLRAVIARCHDKLPERPRAALTARLATVGGEGDDALAAGLGMRLNTFLQNVTRARRLLADCLRENGVDVARGLG